MNLKIKTKLMYDGNSYKLRVPKNLVEDLLDQHGQAILGVGNEYIAELTLVPKKTRENIYMHWFLNEPFTAQKEAIA